MNIGENIKNIRKEKGLTQAELGEKLSVSQQMIGQYENGKNSPQMDTLKKIAMALEVNIVDLMGISDYLNSVENEMRQSTNFYDYLASLGYIILEIEHEKGCAAYLKTPNKDIELSSDDIKLLNELEDSTSKDIKRTIDLLIATKK